MEAHDHDTKIIDRLEEGAARLRTDITQLRGTKRELLRLLMEGANAQDWDTE